MEANASAQLDLIGRETLTPLVQRLLASDTATILDWSHQPLKGGIGGGVGGTALCRFSGHADNRGISVPWTLVLKVLQARADEHPSDSHYWKREAEVYRSGWLTQLPGGLVAPRCLGVTDQSDQASWIWLEEIIDEIGPHWPLERYGVVARHLGQFNGAYLTQYAAPSWPWLSAAFIRRDLVHAAPGIARLAKSLAHPLVRRLLPGDSSDKVFRLWNARETFLKYLARLPQTLCHFDAFRGNLFAQHGSDGREQTVAIDWAFVGTGPIGAEIVALVWVSLVSMSIEPRQAQELDSLVFEGYLDGLRDAGWCGAPEQVRLAFTAATALRRVGTLGYIALFMIDEHQDPETAPQPAPEALDWLDNLAESGYYVERLSEEAQQLVASLA